MAECCLRKATDSLRPMAAADADALSKIKTGDVVLVEFRKPRNVLFHRKYFSLLNFAFEHWEPEAMKFKGREVGKSLDVFRGWIICQAGFYDLAITPDGRVKASPMSISFAKMDEQEFEDLYSKTIDVILKCVLKNYKNRDELESVLETVIGYV